jgi:tRNA pseudouridine38-40 synthase
VPRYKLTIAYEGTDFCGWQKQEPLAPWAIAHGAGPQGATEAAPPGDTREVGLGRKMIEELPDRPGRVALRTVQHVLERAVSDVVREPVELVGSSRTDSGVHARGQVAAFTCSGDESDENHKPGTGWPVSRGVDRLMIAINGRLPEDCLVTAAEIVPAEFNPIGDTESKGYSYTFHCAKVRALFDRRRVHHIWEPLDVAAMRDAAARFVGEHDFAAFAAAGHGRLSTVRKVFACDISEPEPQRVRLDISGSGFLWNMVRIIAGTLAEVGRGRMKPERVSEALANGDRRSAGPTLPPTGLCLEWIRFGPPGSGRARALQAGPDEGFPD